ncbi:DegT/DnrJ/EryC1/StrS family aminotransferase [Pseudonocardia sp. TRM90224]|uniref:DegT/DnrJ/EryC1/StrS family aminotransferase n=1 Tax=Pseudonocardia sp. TRM90224 TaxID=2812678 RepID=UPI001E5F55D2|nr:DegT/DnrJ/EryC1/StrS family aminotransferase [Pseudonocardia sp. TRM90224]
MVLRFPSMADADGRTLGDEELAALGEVIRSGMLSSVWGTAARALEREVAQLYGARHAISCSSGTAALHLSVVAAAPEPGDEIITTPITDFGTVAPILAQNAVPVFADVDAATGALDPDAVAALIGPRTRAIIAVHLFGAPAPVAELRALADERGLVLIEDCAQAWLTRVPDGRLAGTAGSVGTLSLQQWKHITCGDGGLVITDDDRLAKAMRLFADKGWDRAAGRSHETFGLNYRMTELQAAVARAQLAKLPAVVARRRASAEALLAAIDGLPDTVLPRPDGHAWWLFPLVRPRGDAPQLAAHLSAAGIPARAGYLREPLNRAPVWSGPIYGSSAFPLDGAAGPTLPCPRAEELVERTLLVIDWNENYTDEHVALIAKELRSFA